MDDDEDAEAKRQQVKAETPQLDESILDGFDMKKQNIASLILNANASIDLSTESKPVRDTIQTNYGVSYFENIDHGGQANCTLRGNSFYDSPKRNMRRDEFMKK